MDRSGLWLGGSDWGKVYNLPPYGCRRRLVLQKQGVKPDFSLAVTAAMQRGIDWEAAVADHWSRTSKTPIAKAHDHKNPNMPDWWRGTPDYITIAPPLRVVEIKTAGQQRFKEFQRKGLPDEYQLQMQHYLALANVSAGVFVVAWLDGNEIAAFEFKADAAIREKLLAEGEAVMREVRGEAPLPERLEKNDNRCLTCEYRTSCRAGESALQDEIAAAGGGAGETDRIPYKTVRDAEADALIGQYHELRRIKDEAEDALAECRNALRAKLGEHKTERAAFAAGKVLAYDTVAERIDAKRLKAEEPAIAAKYLNQTKQPVFKVTGW